MPLILTSTAIMVAAIELVAFPSSSALVEVPGAYSCFLPSLLVLGELLPNCPRELLASS